MHNDSLKNQSILRGGVVRIPVARILIFLLTIIIPAEPLFPYSLRIVILGVGLFYAIILKRKLIFTSHFKFEIIFIILLFISLIYSPPSADGLGIIMMLVKAFLQSYCIILLSLSTNKKTDEQINGVLNNYLFGTILILIYTFIVEGNDLLNALGKWRLGVTVFANNGTFMLLSYSIIISLLWSIYCLFDKKNKKYLLPVIFLLLASVASGTKKVIFALAIAIVAYVFIKYRKKSFKLFSRLLVILIVFVIGLQLVLKNEFLYRSIGHRIENYILSISGEEQGTTSTVSRGLMREYGIELFLRNPIFGNGVSSFRSYYYKYAGEYLYSHCNYVELLCNQGLVGFLVYYGYLLWLLIKIMKLSKDGKENYSFYFAFLVTLLVIDYGQVSYYRIHYMLVCQLISLAIYNEKLSFKKLR